MEDRPEHKMNALLGKLREEFPGFIFVYPVSWPSKAPKTQKVRQTALSLLATRWFSHTLASWLRRLAFV